MKKIVATILTAGLMTSSLSAGSFDREPAYTALAGVELGYTRVNYDYGAQLNNTSNSVWMPVGGIKVGAESEDYRAFISGKYFYDTDRDYDYITTYGAEFQYKFHPAKVFDIFIGGDVGVANIKWRANGETFARTISTGYFGGEMGLNFHFDEKFDLELAGRVLSLDATNTIGGVSYRVNTISTAYVGLVFKWEN